MKNFWNVMESISISFMTFSICFAIIVRIVIGKTYTVYGGLPWWVPIILMVPIIIFFIIKNKYIK